MRACTSGSCGTAGSFTSVTLADGSALPSWITTKESNTKIDIAPTDGSVKASNDWTVKVVFTPTNGSNNPTYNAVVITVTCEITSFAVSGAGTTSHTYNVFDEMKIIDGSTLTYTQSPSCGYTFTNSFAYTIPSGIQSFVKQGGYMPPSINIDTADTSKAGGPYTLTITNSITVDSGQG